MKKVEDWGKTVFVGQLTIKTFILYIFYWHAPSPLPPTFGLKMIKKWKSIVEGSFLFSNCFNAVRR